MVAVGECGLGMTVDMSPVLDPNCGGQTTIERTLPTQKPRGITSVSLFNGSSAFMLQTVLRQARNRFPAEFGKEV